MSARLHHVLSGDLESVVLSLTMEGGQLVTATIPASEAKRFAWSMLNDLDPEEVDRAAGIETVRGESFVPMGFRKWAVLLLVESGVEHASAIAARLEKPRSLISVQLCQLKDQGLIVRHGGAGRQPGAWRLTSEGLFRAQIARDRMLATYLVHQFTRAVEAPAGAEISA